MQKLFIKNRKDQKIAVVIDQPAKARGMAFVTHGLGGFKEQAHIRTMAQAFLDNGYTVVTFDTTNTFGESDGSYDDATVTNYSEDLEDVVAWSKSQPWYMEPFCLAGHSLGAISVALYAQKYPKLVKGLAPISTVVSGKLSMDREKDFDGWKKKGYQEKISNSKPGLVGKLKWSHMEDRLKYDLLPKANLLTMPVLMIVGSEDVPTPVRHQQILYDALPGRKEMYVIEGSPHTFRDEKHLKQVYQHFDKWIKTL